MDWKLENPQWVRFIDDITDEEARIIALLAFGDVLSNDMQIINIVRNCNPNNIPHVEIHVKYYETIIGEDIEDYVGIFDNLDVYLGKNYHKTWGQREIFDYFNKQGFKENEI